jgi:hypothetical protein
MEQSSPKSATFRRRTSERISPTQTATETASSMLATTPPGGTTWREAAAWLLCRSRVQSGSYDIVCALIRHIKLVRSRLAQYYRDRGSIQR